MLKPAGGLGRLIAVPLLIPLFFNQQRRGHIRKRRGFGWRRRSGSWRGRGRPWRRLRDGFRPRLGGGFRLGLRLLPGFRRHGLGRGRRLRRFRSWLGFWGAFRRRRHRERFHFLPRLEKLEPLFFLGRLAQQDPHWQHPKGNQEKKKGSHAADGNKPPHAFKRRDSSNCGLQIEAPASMQSALRDRSKGRCRAVHCGLARPFPGPPPAPLP